MRKDWGILLAAALAIAFGLQEMRALFPSMVYVLKDRFGMSSIALGALGVAWFALAGAAGAGAGRGIRALPHAILAAAIVRATLQIWPGDPLGFLILAALGVVLFFAVWAALVRGAPNDAVVVFLMGAAIDTAVHAARSTLDLHWSDGGADLVALSLTAVASILATRGAAAFAVTCGASARPGVSGIALFAWGPFLFLHLEWFGNVARLSANTGFGSALAGAAVLASCAAAVCVVRLLSDSRAMRGTAGIALLALLAFAPVEGIAGALGCLLAFAAAAFVLHSAVRGSSVQGRATSGALSCAGGAMTLLLFVFAHYAGYDLPLPWDRGAVWIAAGALFVGPILARGMRGGFPPPHRASAAPVLGILALAAALPAFDAFDRAPAIGAGAPLASPSSAPPLSAPFEITTFNLHAGFDERGDFAFGAMMDSLLASNPDVVALQEVSRGWLVNGSADLYELARDRFEGAASVFGPSIDADWGNAVFSRAAIAANENTPLPPRELALTRAVLRAEIAMEGVAAPLRVLATHFHHRAADEGIRAIHARDLVERFGGGGGASDPTPASAAPAPALLLGDFNAIPGSESLRILEEAGWIDVANPAAPTYPSRAPDRRIDTIFFRSLTLVETRVEPAWGSDHRAVRARFTPAAPDAPPAAP